MNLSGRVRYANYVRFDDKMIKIIKMQCSQKVPFYKIAHTLIYNINRQDVQKDKSK